MSADLSAERHWWQAVAARYGLASSDALAPTAPAARPNAVLESLLAHRSVRAYSDRPLPADLLQTLVAAGQSASTSSHLQAWSVVAVEDAARKARLAALAGRQGHVAEAPLLLVFLADLSRLRGLGTARGLPGDGLGYLESLVVGVADAALAAQNMVVALESLGLGCCYIGAMRNQPEAVAQELRLPPECFAVFGLSIGYPDPAVDSAVKPRLPQAMVLHRDTYAAPAASGYAEFDERMKTFQRGQRMPEAGWTAPAAARVRGPDAMSGRHLLQAALKRLGFGLS
ncbi:NADPH-dependent oxidoreductase [Variovorax sp. dw_954]|uniref:NADPH-dependent oxidoreductase n=1 Tax=Variovorax sp. dw_954 TaxID=2720078 RepID=UPI001BD232D3|nr:NADPH-dependent oxidoreductase [Variovorax sp. dw_954]